MSIINQMLRDLEKRRPSGAVIGLQVGVNDPQGIAGNILPAVARRRNTLHPALWALPLLVIGLSAGALALWPSALEGMSMTSLASMLPGASAMPSQPVSTRAAPNHMLQPNPVPAPLALVTPESGLAEKDDNATASIALPQAAPQSIIVTPALKTSSAPVFEAVASPNPPPLPSAVVKQKPQPLATAPRPPLSEDRLHIALKKTAEAPMLNKHMKEITPAQQAENEYRKAAELLQQGRLTRAMESLAQALQLDAGHVAARQTLVGLLVEAKRFSEAEQQLQEGLKVDAGLDANRPGLAMMLARLQVERGDTRAGLDTLQRSLPDVQENTVEHADYQAFLAALLQRDGRHGDAIEHYLQALRAMPQSGIWLMGIGISLQAENRLQDAQEAFQRAKTSNTLSPDLQAFVEQRLKQLKR